MNNGSVRTLRYIGSILVILSILTGAFWFVAKNVIANQIAKDTECYVTKELYKTDKKATNNRLDKIDNSLTSLDKKVDDRFDAVNGRLDRVLERLSE